MTSNVNSDHGRQQPWVTALGVLRKQVSYGLFAAAVLLAVFTAWMIFKYHWESAPAVFWGSSIAFITLGAGLWFLLDESPDVAGLESGRALVLIVGGLSGFATWLVSLWLAVSTWGWVRVWMAGGGGALLLLPGWAAKVRAPQTPVSRPTTARITTSPVVLRFMGCSFLIIW